VGDLLRHVLPLALGAAISPAVLTVSVLLLSAPRRPVARATLFLLGTTVVLVVLSVIGFTVLHQAVQDKPSATKDAISGSIDATIALVLYALALRTVVRARVGSTDEQAETAPQHHQGDGLGTAFLLGVVVMTTNITTILLYLPAMKDIATSSVSDTDKTIVFVLALLITSIPALVPLLLRIVAPGPSIRVLSRINESLTRHRRTVAIAVELIFGTYLLIKGLGQL